MLMVYYWCVIYFNPSTNSFKKKSEAWILSRGNFPLLWLYWQTSHNLCLIGSELNFLLHKADRDALLCQDTKLFPGGSRLVLFLLDPRPDLEFSSSAQSQILGNRKDCDWLYYMRILMIIDLYWKYILSWLVTNVSRSSFYIPAYGGGKPGQERP